MSKEDCVLEKIAIDGFDLVISYDEIDWNPREHYDNLGTMVIFHSRYSLGDIHNYSVDDVRDIAESKDYIALPIYMYEHSGITISVNPFSCPWDSGQVGYIFVSNEKVKKDFGWSRITSKRLLKIKEYLTNEVKELDAFITGQVYRFDVYRDGELLDGLGPFTDSNDAILAGKDVIKYLANELGVQLSLDLAYSGLLG